MNRKIIFILLAVSLLLSVSWGKKSKRAKRLTGESIVIKQEPYSSEEIYKLKELYDAGNHSALDALVKIYQDKNQIYDIRILTLEMLSGIDNPLVKDAIKSNIENVEFIELEFLAKSIQILHSYGDLESVGSLVEGLSKSENKIMDLRKTIVDAIGVNGTEDEILTLLDLYEVSMTNHARMNELLALTFGNMEDDSSFILA